MKAVDLESGAGLSFNIFINGVRSSSILNGNNRKKK